MAERERDTSLDDCLCKQLPSLITSEANLCRLRLQCTTETTYSKCLVLRSLEVVDREEEEKKGGSQNATMKRKWLKRASLVSKREQAVPFVFSSCCISIVVLSHFTSNFLSSEDIGWSMSFLFDTHSAREDESNAWTISSRQSRDYFSDSLCRSRHLPIIIFQHGFDSLSRRWLIKAYG